MTGEQLKASLLQMAIEGKLVLQDPNEESAEILFDKIQQEKQLLIKEGKIKKEKALPNITEEDIPYEIPSSWKWCRLQDIGIHFDYGTSTKCHQDKLDNDIPILRMGNIFDGKIIYKNLKYASKSMLELPFLYIKHGDILFNRTNSFELVGKCAFFDEVDDNYSFASYLIRISLCQANSKFIAYYINSYSCKKTQIEPKTTQQNGQANFNGTKLKNILVPLPPLAEQSRIVARLEELLPLAEQFGEAQDKLMALEKDLPAKLKASLLQEAIEGKLVPQLDSEPAVEQIGDAPEDVPFAIPDKWKWVQTKQLGTIVSGGTPKTSISTYWSDSEIAWITPADLGKNHSQTISHGSRYISCKGMESSSATLMPKGSVIFSSRAPIGYLAIANNDLCTNQGCKSVVPNSHIVLSKWIYWMLMARTSDIQERASGTTFLEISGKKFGETLLPLPPLAEQRRIVARLEELLAEVEKMG